MELRHLRYFVAVAEEENVTRAAARGVALVQQGFECLAGPRLKIRPLVPAPPPFVAGFACRKGALSLGVSDFISAARRTNPEN